MKELSRQRIETSVKGIAESINRNEMVIQDLEWACEAEEWNTDVVFQIKEAQMLLGQALATLVNWFDEPEEKKEG